MNHFSRPDTNEVKVANHFRILCAQVLEIKGHCSADLSIYTCPHWVAKMFFGRKPEPNPPHSCYSPSVFTPFIPMCFRVYFRNRSPTRGSQVGRPQIMQLPHSYMKDEELDRAFVRRAGNDPVGSLLNHWQHNPEQKWGRSHPRWYPTPDWNRI